MTLAYLGLGSNLGNRAARFREALDRLAADGGIVVRRTSCLYETEPVGVGDQPPYLNAVAEVETTLPARRLLETCLATEAAMGRVRETRWGPRPIDLDLLLYGELSLDEPGLSIPHPRLAERAFALVPLSELAPNAVLPSGTTVAARAARLLGEPGPWLRRVGRPLLASPWEDYAAKAEVAFAFPSEGETGLLAILRAAGGRPVSGQVLARELGVTRAAVWKKVEALREAGQPIEAIRRQGYRLAPTVDALTAATVVDKLATAVVGRPCVFVPSLASTNAEARRLAGLGCPEGLTVVADEQTAGRGRRGRAWLSPPGVGIWLSVVLRPPCSPAEAVPFSLGVAVAVSRAVERVAGARPAVKWPNDLLLNGRKFCGILTELIGQETGVDHLVAGIGLNVLTPREAFPDELRSGATSLAAEGFSCPRADLARAVLEELEGVYRTFLTGAFDRVVAEWRERSAILGRRVRVQAAAGWVEGVAEDVDGDGALILRLVDGTRRRFVSGEVTLRLADES